MSEDKPRKQFTPGTIVRVDGVLMGVGQASLRGLLDRAEDINDISQAERIAAREGVALEGTDTLVDGEPEPVELTPAQKRAATIAKKKADREAVIKRGDKPASVDAEQAEDESQLGETSKPVAEPGTIGDGEPPAGTDEDETGREDPTGHEPEAGDPEFSPEATEAEVEAAESTEDVDVEAPSEADAIKLSAEPDAG